jgi:FKBP-type peptidyl-prolyl cis-trans isomerase FklB
VKLKLVFILCMVLVSSHVLAGDAPGLKTQKDHFSYAIGIDIANNIKKMGIDLDVDLFELGLTDALAASSPLMTAEEAKTVLAAMQKDLQARQQEQMKSLGEANKKEGEAFLAANRMKEGVKVLPSGLQYKVIKEGKGQMPKATDTVAVNFRGTLIDGTEVDSSYRSGGPATLRVNGVIKGWSEALQLMKQGSKWQLFLPSDLAYGERGAQGNSVGPNAVLIFEVELVLVNPVNRHRKVAD